jgi:hypothetical protein
MLLLSGDVDDSVHVAICVYLTSQGPLLAYVLRRQPTGYQ